MRIGIDARTILNPKKGDAIGVGHYTYQLISHILDIDKENEYVIFFDFKVREKDIRKFTRSNSTIRFYPFSDYRKYLPGAYNEILTAGTLRKENLDVLHSTSPTSRIPMSYTGKTMVTFHDMAMYKIPECFPRTKMAREKISYKLMANKVDKIIAVSESIKNDIENIFNVGSKTEVIHSGLDKRFFENFCAGSERVLGEFGIKKKYILFLGTIEPSKNITRLLQAFSEFKKKFIQEKFKISGRKRFDYQLVLAGKRGWLAKEYIQIIKDLGLKKDVIFTGYIIGDELCPLFRKSEFFILPSLYEGFGMTVLEAFATETPAIISQTESLKEIAGNSAYYVNPLDVNEIAEAIMKFSKDEQLRDEYRKKGLERVRKFDWDDVARKTINIYKSLK